MKRFNSIYSKIVKAYFDMPRFLRFGVLVFIVSGAVDLSYHAVSAFWPGSLDAYLGPDGYYTHLALFFGMLFIVIGVILTRPDPAHHRDSTVTSAASSQNNSAAKHLIVR